MNIGGIRKPLEDGAGGAPAGGPGPILRAGGRWIALLLALPLTNPEIVLAAGLLNLFVGLHLPRGPLTLLLSHSLFCLSYAALTL